ncbi:MAG: hypothetical protein ABMA25_09940, partial [Ilumatobacteraceae bacterium]
MGNAGNDDTTIAGSTPGENPGTANPDMTVPLSTPVQVVIPTDPAIPKTSLSDSLYKGKSGEVVQPLL